MSKSGTDMSKRIEVAEQVEAVGKTLANAIANSSTLSISEVFDMSEPSASRIKNGEQAVKGTEGIAKYLVAAGLAVYPNNEEVITISKKKWQAMILFAQEGMENNQ